MDHFANRFNALKSQLIAEYRLDVEGIHGPQHWDRVHAFGLWLARESEADLAVVRWFSLFHDCQRHDEGWGPRTRTARLKARPGSPQGRAQPQANGAAR